MKKLLIITALLSSSLFASAQKFEDYFEDRTLRLDYTFAGDDCLHMIYVDELVSLPHWYGRRQRLAELPLRGNGQITVRSKTDSVVIYRHAFSTPSPPSSRNGWLPTKPNTRRSRLRMYS